MSTSLVLGNGNVLLNIDKYFNINDLFWPYVGQNNHLTGHPIKMYFWDFGNFVSLHDSNVFSIDIKYKEKSLVGETKIFSSKYGIELTIENTVLPNKDIYISKCKVKNLWDMSRNLKFYLNSNFYLKDNNIGNTVCWYPQKKLILNYKDDVYIAAGSLSSTFKYSCARTTSMGGEGTLPNLENGELNMYPINHGDVESTILFDVIVDAESEQSFDFYLLFGHSLNECLELEKFLNTKRIDDLLQDSDNFWKSYMISTTKDHDNLDLENIFDDKILSQKIADLYYRSIAVLRTQIDNRGAIIAGNDSSHLKYRKDTYSYLWHRDGALVASALNKIGLTTPCEKFFRLSSKLLEKEGYFLHKYNPNGTYGSSWHPWIDGEQNPILPIQEDETSSVLWSLSEYYEKYNNQELISELWEPLIKPAANFLCSYKFNSDHNDLFSDIRNNNTWSCLKNSNLSLPSFDLWEEIYGVFTYTVSSIYGGLMGASFLALRLGQHEFAEKYSKVAIEIKKAAKEYLYDSNQGHFIHGIYKKGGENFISPVNKPDSSICGLWQFGMYDVNDPIIINTMSWLEEELWNKHSIGGVLRYKDDYYYRQDANTDGNPWYISTLWLAQYYIKRNEMQKAKKYIEWVINNIHSTYLMSEQIDCLNGSELSVKPLTWSHAEFINTISDII